ncbi:MAG: hypothetical protein ACRERC_21745 [Candidatus Binatia bacterium]
MVVARATGTAPPAWWPWCVLAIALLAGALRVAYVLTLRSTPWFDQLVVDPEFYDAWATRIAAGDWMGARPFYMDPLYPYLLAGLYRLVGRDLLLARLLNVALSAAACALVARLGRLLGGWRVGALAALGFAVYAPEIFYVGEVEKTTLSVLLTSACLVLWLGASLAARFGAGVALGLAALTRANLLLFAPLCVLLCLWPRAEWRARVGGLPRAPLHALLFAAGCLLALAPVAWRNHHLSGEWVLTTAQAGQNFYIGNNPYNPSGAYGVLPFVRANPHFEEGDFRAEAERRAGAPLTAAEVSRFWFAEAFRFMREQPAEATGVMLRKAALFWNDFEVSDNQDQYLMERDSWVLRLPLLGFGLLAPLAVLGALAGWRGNHAVRLLGGFVLIYWATVVGFFIYSRYRIQVVPALLALGGLGVVTLVERVRAGDWARVAGGAAVAVVVGWFCLHSIDIFSQDNEQVVEMRLRHLADAYFQAGQPERAVAALYEAIDACPVRCRGAFDDLVGAYLRDGQLRPVEALLRQFVHRQPHNAEAAGALEMLHAASP